MRQAVISTAGTAAGGPPLLGCRGPDGGAGAVAAFPSRLRPHRPPAAAAVRPRTPHACPTVRRPTSPTHFLSLFLCRRGRVWRGAHSGAAHHCGGPAGAVPGRHGEQAPTSAGVQRALLKWSCTAWGSCASIPCHAAGIKSCLWPLVFSSSCLWPAGWLRLHPQPAHAARRGQAQAGAHHRRLCAGARRPPACVPAGHCRGPARRRAVCARAAVPAPLGGGVHPWRPTCWHPPFFFLSSPLPCAPQDIAAKMEAELQHGLAVCEAEVLSFIEPLEQARRGHCC